MIDHLVTIGDPGTIETLCTQLNDVRVVGRFNMLDKAGVRSVAEDLELDDLVEWLDASSRGEYARFLMGPFNEWVGAHPNA